MPIDPHKQWDAVVSVATLGTSRTALPAEILSESALVPAGDTRERSLLRVAAMQHLSRLAGMRFPSLGAPAPAPPAPATPARVVSEAAAWRLGRMLTGEHRELVPEWFALAKRAGAVVPPHWLPPVLDALAPAGRIEFGEVLGAHAQWLARRNAAWSHGGSADGDDSWTTGTLAERLVLLTGLRRRDTAAARRLVESTWPADPADAREAFVRALLDGLGPGDEDFLERALDDKRKGVRVAAADLLSRLPASAHGLRNAARLDALVRFEDARPGRGANVVERRLAVTLPSSLEKDAIRDGIDAKPPAGRGIGERTFWLAQMVSMAPPAYWTRRFDLTPASFVDAVLATEHGEELLAALSLAAGRHPEAGWIATLCGYWIAQAAGDGESRALTMIPSLLGALAPSEREALLQSLLRTGRPMRFELVHALLAGGGDLVWSAETTRLAIARLTEICLAGSQRWAAYARAFLAAWGYHADVNAAVETLAPLMASCPADSPWLNALEHLGEIIEFRAAMQKELLA